MGKHPATRRGDRTTPVTSEASVDEVRAFAAGIDSDTPHIALPASVEAHVKPGCKPYTAAAFFHFKVTGPPKRHRATVERTDGRGL